MHAIVIAFTIIEDGACPNSPQGNHSIALLNAEENYDDFSESLEDIQNEIKDLKSAKVNDFEYKIEYFLGADWKFLLSVLELKLPMQNTLAFGVHVLQMINTTLVRVG